MLDFEYDLSNLINHHNIDNDLNTPDFILANYIIDCLVAYNTTNKANKHWHRPVESASKHKELANAK